MVVNIADIVTELCSLLQRHNKSGAELSENTALSADLNVDSVEIMDLVMEIEDKFDIVIPINQLSVVESVRDLAKIVHDRMKGR
jgi:acyl carrier protein